MFDRKAKLNPTLALALQAKSAKRPTSKQQDGQNTPARFRSASYFRQLARSGKDTFSIGIPTVCTIH